MSMNPSNLVFMANKIAQFFEAQPDREAAIIGVRDHLRKFWDPRMRNSIIAHLEAGGQDMRELTVAAVKKLAEEQRAAA